MTTPSATPPVMLGRYTLIRRLASGGMGEVYLAESEGAANFKRRVAIKRILPHLANNPEFVDKFIDEANLMVQLHHGNIVPVQELQDHDGELYIVMEFLPGRDLKAVLRKLRGAPITLPTDLALWLCTEILAGLDYAHRKVGPDGQPLNIVHRDVSPSNIMLGAGGEVKVCDFGIARARGGLHRSVSGTLQGKFVYMSPEQADGRKVDPRSDVFSAGLVLYELLTGVRPFEGESETETLRLVRQAQVPPPSAHDPALAPLDDLVLKALAPDPADRYATAADMRRALQHDLADRRSTADAAALAEFLRALYPEGVVPAAEPEGPVSLDDALMAQLGMMTPSVDAMGRTRTATGPNGPRAGTPARRATDRVNTGPGGPGAPSGPTGPTGPTGPLVSDPSFPSFTQPAGRKRSLGLGLVLGALLASGLAWWLTRPAAMALVRPEVRAGALRFDDYELRVDDALVAPGHALRPGNYKLCVSGDRFKLRCFSQTLVAGQNTPVLEVQARSFVTVTVDPPGIPAEITFDKVPIRGTTAEISGTTVVRVSAPGYDASPAERTVFERPGDQTIHFDLISKTPTAVGPPDAGPPDAAAPDSGPRVVRNRPPPTQVRIESTPVANVTLDGKPHGQTPVVIREPGAVVLSAKNFVSQTIAVKAGQNKALEIALVPFGGVTARATPPASEIWVDGRKVGVGAISNLPLPPGPHLLSARFTHPTSGQVYEAKQSVDVRPGVAREGAVILNIAVPE